jgi:hypothetical protein
MAIIPQGILGGVKNKIGNVVGSSWKGIPVLKSKPLSVANPRTAGQVSQRDAFALASQIGSQILASWIKPYWDRSASKQSGYNAWVSANVGFMAGGVIADYSNLIMSNGKLTPASSMVVAADNSDNTITLTPSVGSLNQFSSSTDIAQAVYFNATRGYWVVSGDLGDRSADPYTITDNTMATGDVLHVWLAYKRSDLTYVSPSTYQTATVVA